MGFAALVLLVILLAVAIRGLRDDAHDTAGTRSAAETERDRRPSSVYPVRDRTPDGTPGQFPGIIKPTPTISEVVTGLSTPRYGSGAPQTAPGDAITSDALNQSSPDLAAIPPPGTVVLEGRVTRGVEPQPDLKLALVSQDGSFTHTAVTNGNGEYEFLPVATGAYVLTLNAGPYGITTRRLSFLRENERVRQDFNIALSHSIRGMVATLRDGLAIPDLPLLLEQAGETRDRTTTDSAGNFLFLSPEPGSYTVAVDSPLYSRGEGYVTINIDGVDPELLRITAEPLGSLTVQVLTPSGAGVPRALVSLYGNAVFNDPFGAMGSMETDAVGRAVIPVTRVVNDIAFHVGAYHEGYVPGWSGELSKADFTGRVVQVVLGSGGMVKGRVIDEEDVPLENVSVTVRQGFRTTGVIFQRLSRPYPSATSIVDGTFQLGPLELGLVGLSFAAEGYIPEEREFAITGPVIDVGDIKLQSSDAANAERVFGVIVDERNTPMVNHNVFMRNARGKEEFFARTDSRGGFRIDKVPEGDYVIYTNGSALRDNIYITLEQVYPFAKPGEGSLYLFYDMSQSIRFVLQDSEGKPVSRFRAGINVKYSGSTGFGGIAESLGMAYDHTFSTDNGDAVLRNILAGTANLTIYVDGSGSKEIRDITIPVGGEVDLGTIRAESGAAVTGRVIALETKLPIGGATVRAVAPLQAPSSHPLYALPLSTTSDPNGNFSIRDVPAGQADLLISKTGRALLRRTVTVTAREETKAGELPLRLSARLRGAVTSAQGEPLPDILIVVEDQNVFVDRVGRYYFESLTPGRVMVRAEDRTSRFARKEQEIELEEGKEALLNFQLDLLNP